MLSQALPKSARPRTAAVDFIPVLAPCYVPLVESRQVAILLNCMQWITIIEPLNAGYVDVGASYAPFESYLPDNSTPYYSKVTGS
jgi:hypothetical protein